MDGKDGREWSEGEGRVALSEPLILSKAGIGLDVCL